MEWLKVYYHILGVGFIGIIILAAHWLADRQYSWTENTISQLAAQGYSKRWVMRMGFIGFGCIMILGILLKIADREIVYLVDVPVLLYAAAILLTGIFSTEPVIKGQPFNQTSDILHAVFAMTAGVAISIALLMSALLAPSTQLKWAHAFFLILVTLTYGLFGFRKKYNGIIQRLLYLVSFAWLVILYNV